MFLRTVLDWLFLFYTPMPIVSGIFIGRGARGSGFRGWVDR